MADRRPNIAKDNPDMLHELQRLFLIEADKHNVPPLDDRRVERFNTDLAGRPTLIQGNSQLLFGGMGRHSENSVLNLKNKSHSITAEVVCADGNAKGVIIAQGGEFGGWSLYAKEGRLKYGYNLFGFQRFYTEGISPLPARNHQVRMESAYDGAGLVKGDAVTLFVDGEKLGTGRVAATQSMLFSADETCDVGRESGSPVCEDYDAETAGSTAGSTGSSSSRAPMIMIALSVLTRDSAWPWRGNEAESRGGRAE